MDPSFNEDFFRKIHSGTDKENRKNGVVLLGDSPEYALKVPGEVMFFENIKQRD